jgi:hypothetical protein
MSNEVPSYGIFMLSNAFSFWLIAMTTSKLTPNTNIPYIISAFIYSIFTISGMLHFDYKWYHYLGMLAFALMAPFYSQHEMKNNNQGLGL